MNKTKLWMLIGAATAALYTTMPKEESKAVETNSVLIESSVYPIELLNNGEYYYTDGNTYELLINGKIVTLPSTKVLIVEKEEVVPHIVEYIKADIIKPYDANPKTYDEYTIVVPKGFAKFAYMK